MSSGRLKFRIRAFQTLGKPNPDLEKRTEGIATLTDSAAYNIGAPRWHWEKVTDPKLNFQKAEELRAQIIEEVLAVSKELDVGTESFTYEP